MFKSFVICVAFLLSCLCLNAQNIAWELVAPGVWKGTVGRPESYNLSTASGVKPYLEGLNKLGSATFPMLQQEVVAQLRDGKTYLSFPLKKEEQLFGFGLNFQTVHQRGKILELHVDHFGSKDNGRTHAPTPFYVSSAGYGVFVNSARYLKVYAGTGVRRDSKNAPVARDRNTDKNWASRPYSDAVEFLVPAEGVEFYVFAGPTPLDAVSRYNLFNGGGPLPPRWGLGFTQRVKTLFSAGDVEKEAATFAEKGFPLDFIGLEPGWQSKAYPCSFEWDKGRFPDPAGFVSVMLKKGIRLNLWTNPYVAPESPIYKEIKPFTADHTVWLGVIPDLTIPEAQNLLFGQLKKSQVDIGVSGYKFDEVDGYDHYLWPDVTTFPSGKSAEQMRQTYGLLTQRYSADLFYKRNQRTYGLVRGSNGGGTSFPYVIYNDYYNHEDFITALINSSFAGVLWTPEVRASKTGEEWLRRMQSVVFSPMAMINAWSSGTKPWSYPEVEQQVKDMAILRMQMMPYWYSEFAKYHFQGIPPFRAMNLEPGFNSGIDKDVTNTDLEENPYVDAVAKEVKDQYMAGEYLLVAPMFAGKTTRTVILPKGKWFDFYTGDFVGDGTVITITPGLDRIPVYVKNGGIIPMGPALMHAPKPTDKIDLEIRYYGDKPGTYQLYDDDGESFDYEKGAFSFREIRMERAKDGKLKASISAAVKGKPNTLNKISFKAMTTKTQL
ncbi:TIM-barrel domain-containing protein [Pedobacter gandavensis]|uniref:glycoside hydrolase family 31 protein n=1 Tax=Pedobacter gandavensis TaxID=2679963 RepID=UPI0029308170|nr:TIM-barrel domain-containing protein [Pedobacter gandavensis]